jgi:hypothetical protein
LQKNFFNEASPCFILTSTGSILFSEIGKTFDFALRMGNNINFEAKKQFGIKFQAKAKLTFWDKPAHSNQQ